MNDDLIKQEQLKIARYIKELREQRELTQEEFAKRLATSQSAIARMEKGLQNFTTETLTRIGSVLDQKIIDIADVQTSYKVEGGLELKGEVSTNFSKNGAMGLMCAALLNKNRTLLHGIPRIEEVNRMIEILTSLGVQVKWEGDNTLRIKPPELLSIEDIDIVAVKAIRSSIMLIAPFVHQNQSFALSRPSGCELGARSLAAHVFGLEQLGIKVKDHTKDLEISVKKFKNGEVIMYESGDTATENILMAAALIPGKTIIKYASSNYMVQEMCHFLGKMGVRIDGVGTPTLTVYGVEQINQRVDYHNSEDPIESMTFISAAIMTKSEITVRRCPIDFLELELFKLKMMGFEYKIGKQYVSYNGKTRLVDIHTHPSYLTALDEKIYARPYPGINIDNLPFFALICTQATGNSLIHDWVFENRAGYYTLLNKLGAHVFQADIHRVIICGHTGLMGANVTCPPALRPAMVLLLGMLGAKGTSILKDVYPIQRGYQDTVERLNALGARIESITS